MITKQILFSLSLLHRNTMIMKKLFLLLALIAASITATSQPAHYITFNGTDQYVRIPHHEDFDIAANQSFTLTGWVRNESYTSYPRYVCKRDMSVTGIGNERSGYEFFGTGSVGQSLGLNTPTSTSGHALSVYTGVTDAQLVNFNFGGSGIWNVTLTQDTRKTGRGNENDVLLKAAVAVDGTDVSAEVELQSITLNLEGTTDLNDIEEIKVYSTGFANSFDERHPQNATLLGSVVPASGDITCNLGGNLVYGTNYLWVVAHVADHATEGNFIDASLKSITTAEETYEITNPSPAGSREIILAHTLLLQPGDYNSTNYRIPAVITAKDGSIDSFDPTSLVEQLHSPNTLGIYPIPASMVVTIPSEELQTINVYNTLGQLIQTISVNGVSEVRLDVSEWASGIYFVEGLDGNGHKASGIFVK